MTAILWELHCLQLIGHVKHSDNTVFNNTIKMKKSNRKKHREKTFLLSLVTEANGQSTKT